MNSVKRFGAVAIATVIAVVGLALPATAAPGNCGAGYGCMWSDPSYKSDGSNAAVIKFQYKIYETDTFSYYWSIFGGDHWGGNNASSLYNNGTTYSTKWFDGEYFTGYSKTILKGNGSSDLLNISLDDMISSACFTSNCA